MPEQKSPNIDVYKLIWNFLSSSQERIQAPFQHNVEGLSITAKDMTKFENKTMNRMPISKLMNGILNLVIEIAPTIEKKTNKLAFNDLIFKCVGLNASNLITFQVNSPGVSVELRTSIFSIIESQSQCKPQDLINELFVNDWHKVNLKQQIRIRIRDMCACS